MASPETLIAALPPLLPCSMGTLIPHLVDIENEIKVGGQGGHCRSSIAANDNTSTPPQIDFLVSNLAITIYSFCWPKFRAPFMKYVDVFIAHSSSTAASNAQARSFDEEEREDLFSVGDAFSDLKVSMTVETPPDEVLRNISVTLTDLVSKRRPYIDDEGVDSLLLQCEKYRMRLPFSVNMHDEGLLELWSQHGGIEDRSTPKEDGESSMRAQRRKLTVQPWLNMFEMGEGRPCRVGRVSRHSDRH
ncbi:hypothetical protein HETIRDRAFT_430055 [Heterobasidion irregulare TC 32-1]|uniref:Uncharacterized protein n=1 Tax=Heterobasidion irregulare (strain TC 32-1) TaxID=747525 RepID=W4JUY7_HETIT|nr:uncharacterized protein HETIRDRAFT_430055 [Heterobasidion irregulare TC 32-1]ETW76706.1 hypothetical protein HETIRDRAFT_430055 [Heterobasidion irregulare TC 32-1]